MSKIVKLIIFITGLIGLSYATVVTFSRGLADGTYWFIVWLILLLLWLAGWYISINAEDVRKIPTITESAKVISKLHEKSVDGVSGLVSTTHTYSIVFEFPDKSRKKIEVNAEKYALVREDEIGILHYKQLKNNRLWFVNFQLQ